MRLRPSNAQIWAKPGGCNGYGRMTRDVINKLDDNGSSLEGIACHKLAEIMMKGDDLPEIICDIVVNDEMKESATLYSSFIKSIGATNIETEVEYSDYTRGFIDAWGYNAKTNELDIVDFKYGHRFVSEVENYQMLIYAICLLRDYPHTKTINMTIVQPRCYGQNGVVRTWSIAIEDIDTYRNNIEKATNLAISESSLCVSGSHCIYCPVRHECPTAQRAAMSAVDYMGTDTNNSLSNDDLGRELDLLNRIESLIKARKTGLESQVETLIKKGKSVIGYSLKESLGRLAWNVSLEDVIKQANLMNVEVLKPSELITPTQAKGLGFNKEILDTLTHKPSRGLKLAKVNLTEAQRIFK